MPLGLGSLLAALKQGGNWLGQDEQEPWRQAIGGMASGQDGWGSGLGQAIGGSIQQAAQRRPKSLPVPLPDTRDKALASLPMTGQDAGRPGVAQVPPDLILGKITDAMRGDEGGVPGRAGDSLGVHAEGDPFGSQANVLDIQQRDAPNTNPDPYAAHKITGANGQNLDLKSGKQRFLQGLKGAAYGALQGLATNGSLGAAVGGAIGGGVPGAMDPLRSKQWMYETWDKRIADQDAEAERQKQMRGLELEGAQQKIALGKMQPDMLKAQIEATQALGQQRDAQAEWRDAVLAGNVPVSPVDAARIAAANAAAGASDARRAAIENPTPKQQTAGQVKMKREEIARQIAAEKGMTVDEEAAESLKHRDPNSYKQFIPSAYARALVAQLEQGEESVARMQPQDRSAALAAIAAAKKAEFEQSKKATQRDWDAEIDRRLGAGGGTAAQRQETRNIDTVKW